LSDIWEHTYETWSERQADKYYELLISACQYVSEQPEKGKPYNEVAKDIFGFQAGKHILLYRMLQTSEIEIVRILHEKMDLKNRIKE
jgi:toxin ParE1/3/4